MKNSIALFLVLAVIASSIVVATQAASVSENSWITRPPMPNSKSGLGVAVANGKIYAISGDGTNEEYDPTTLTWTKKPSVPTPRNSFGIAVHQNKIYVIGGNVGFDQSTGRPILCSLNEAYDPLTDTWESKKPMPTNRSQLNANIVNGKIYLIGGRTGGQYSTVGLNEVYDPETDSWTNKAPIPYPVVQYASAVVKDKIYIIGGQDEYADPMNLDLVQIYDPTTDAWSSGAPMNTIVRQAAAGATTGAWAPNRIYVIGGLPDRSFFGTDINQVYDPENDSWTLGASMQTPRFNFAVGVVNDTLYALGGAPSINVQGNAIAANELYIPFGYEGPPPPYWSPPPSPSPSPTASSSPSPSSTPTSTSEPLSPLVIVAIIVAIIAISAITVRVYFQKRKH